MKETRHIDSVEKNPTEHSRFLIQMIQIWINIGEDQIQAYPILCLDHLTLVLWIVFKLCMQILPKMHKINSWFTVKVQIQTIFEQWGMSNG